METKHIFNVSSLLRQVKRNTHEKDIYARANLVLKGARIGDPDFRRELAEIIEREAKKMVDDLTKDLPDPSADVNSDTLQAAES